MENIEQFRKDVSRVMVEMRDLMVRKQSDYGPHAVNNAPGGALQGINVRLHDKMCRVANLLAKGGEAQVSDESILDTYRDMANYAVIAVMYMEGTWPGSPNTRTPAVEQS